jgi:hypothetical protein
MIRFPHKNCKKCLSLKNYRSSSCALYFRRILKNVPSKTDGPLEKASDGFPENHPERDL